VFCQAVYVLLRVCDPSATQRISLIFLTNLAGEELNDDVRKMLERSSNADEERTPDPGSSCFGGAYLRNYVVMSGNYVDSPA
jgi:hypothetical protein